jgi:endonuclease YncB( thermonuclease family)
VKHQRRDDVYAFRRDRARWYPGEAAPRPFRRQRKKSGGQLYALAFLLFAGVFGAGMLYTQAHWLAPSRALPEALGDTFGCTVASITDGDTFRCADGARIRLSGVAARETDGTCSQGHPCPDASAEAATAELRSLASGRTLTCRNVGTTYNRIAAFCQREDGVDLSCAMVSSGTVLRWDRHWGSHMC